MATKLDPNDCFLGTVTVGERGQLVVPADIRKHFGIQTGDRLLIMGHPSQNGLVLFKANAVRGILDHFAAGLSLVESGDASGSEGKVKVSRSRRKKDAAHDTTVDEVEREDD